VGKVSGNRSTLNPHLPAVATTSTTTSLLDAHLATCRIYLVGAVKDTVVYHALLLKSGGV
jgi:hypothetical protein